MGRVLAVACVLGGAMFGVGTLLALFTMMSPDYEGGGAPVWVLVLLPVCSVLSLVVAWRLWRVDNE